MARANETGDPVAAGSPRGWHRFVSGRLWLAASAASSSRSLDQRVACRSDRAVHVLFHKQCAREECGRGFEHCGCEPGRRYCCEECSAIAREKSVREARSTYNARDTEEGRAAHAADQAARRERRRRKAEGAGAGQERVTDSHGAPVAYRDAGAEPSPTAGASAPGHREASLGPAGTAPPPRPVEPPGAGPVDASTCLLVRVGDQRCAAPPDDGQRSSLTASYAVEEAGDAPPVALLPSVQAPLLAAEDRAPIEWLLVVPLEMLRAARRREGTLATCPFCGLHGRICRVVSTEQWRRWIRHGLDPP